MSERTHLTAVSVHRPGRHLASDEVAVAWGGSASGGLRVAGPDEDAVTLAVEAALGLVEHLPTVTTLILARPFRRRGSGDGAAVAAAALGLPASVRTLEVAGSDRCSLTAIDLAARLVRNGADGAVLVLVGDDTRMPPGSAGELRHGHGGAALVVGTESGAAQVCSTSSRSDATPDRWFTDDGTRQGVDERFLAMTVLPGLLASLDRPGGGAPHGNVQVAFPDLRHATRLVSRLGADHSLLAVDAWEHGSPGAVLPIELLSRAIQAAEQGEPIEVLAFGSGVDQLMVEAGDPAEVVWTSSHVAVDIPYATYLRAGGALGQPVTVPEASPVVAWRDLEATVRLVGGRCPVCGAVCYPSRTACPACGSPQPMDPVRLVGEATVVTATTDHVVAGVNPGLPESPVTMVVAETADGARLYLPSVHGQQPAIGSRVRTVPRLAHLGGGFRNYHWRFRDVTHEGKA